MRFDKETLREYESWYTSPCGTFAVAREKLLLDHLIAPWPRRGQRLLEIGCGLGLFLEGFWQAGFDVAGIDPCPELLTAARHRLGRRADLYLGHAEALPFEDREFDYAVLLTVLEFCDNPLRAVKEAVRVARKGVLVGFLNRRSLLYQSHGRHWPWQPKGGGGLLHQARWFSWPEIWEMTLDTAGLRPFRARSVLAGPPCTWRESSPCRQLNSLLLPPGWGAYSGISIELLGGRPITPLLAFHGEPEVG